MADTVRAALKDSSAATQSRQAVNFWILLLLGVVSGMVGRRPVPGWCTRSTGELRTLILRISEGVNQVASSAQQVSASSQELAQGAANRPPRSARPPPPARRSPR